MSPFDQLKLVSQLLDLPIIDKDERSCGIVDDVELTGSAGKEMWIKALLVGPAAYAGRMPRWLYWVTRKIAGDRVATIPAEQVDEIGAVVKLKAKAETFGLHEVEDKVRAWSPRKGAL